MAATLQSLDQGLRVDALDRRFARGIDRGHEHAIGVVERGLELFHQAAEARIAVRLDDGDDAALRALAGGGEHGADFDRVVAVIVDDRDVAVLHRHLADVREAALDAPNAEKPRWIVSSGMPSSSATPIAASAFWTLWRPGIGSSIFSIERLVPSRSRTMHSKRLPPGTGVTLTPRTSACAEKP